MTNNILMNLIYIFSNFPWPNVASSRNNANMQDAINLQQIAEIQRQYLLELASAQHQQQASSSSNRQNNWKP